jgi:hypothetical protein
VAAKHYIRQPALAPKKSAKEKGSSKEEPFFLRVAGFPVFTLKLEHHASGRAGIPRAVG